MAIIKKYKRTAEQRERMRQAQLARWSGQRPAKASPPKGRRPGRPPKASVPVTGPRGADEVARLLQSFGGKGDNLTFAQLKTLAKAFQCRVEFHFIPLGGGNPKSFTGLSAERHVGKSGLTDTAEVQAPAPTKEALKEPELLMAASPGFEPGFSPLGPERSTG